MTKTQHSTASSVTLSDLEPFILLLSGHLKPKALQRVRRHMLRTEAFAGTNVWRLRGHDEAERKAAASRELLAMMEAGQ